MGKAFVKSPVDIITLLDKGGRNRAAELMEMFQVLANLLSGNLTDMHMRDGGVDGVVLKDGTVRRSALNADVYLVRMAQGQYTGDGVANRVIQVADAVGVFTPTEVIVLAATDSNVFESRDDATTVYSYWRTAAGAFTSGAADWQGIVANGFKTGSNAANLSNKSGQVYSWRAFRKG